MAGTMYYLRKEVILLTFTLILVFIFLLIFNLYVSIVISMILVILFFLRIIKISKGIKVFIFTNNSIIIKNKDKQIEIPLSDIDIFTISYYNLFPFFPSSVSFHNKGEIIDGFIQKEFVNESNNNISKLFYVRKINKSLLILKTFVKLIILLDFIFVSVKIVPFFSIS